MGVDYKSIIDRMKASAGLKNDSHVARTLGITPQAVSNYKKRGSLPADLLVKFATEHDLSVDWLIHGSGEKYRPGAEIKDLLGAGEDLEDYNLDKFKSLTPEEFTYLGKLLAILRCSDQSTAMAARSSLDALVKTLGLKKEP